MMPPPTDAARRPRPRQAIAAVALTVGLIGAGAVVLSSDGSTPAGASTATATAQERSLRVLDTELGNLARADTTTVVYDGTGGRVGGGPAGSAPQVQGMSAGTATVADLTPAAAQTCPSTTSSSSSTTSTTSTTTPTSSSSTTTTVPCPTTTSSTTTTVPPTTTSWPRRPDSQTTLPSTPTTPEPDQDGGDGIDGGDPDGGPSRMEAAPDGSAQLPTGADDGQGAESGDPSATLTELLPIGDSATRGTVLYRADDEPIVALLAAEPLFRDLTVGVDDGADVLALEQNLAELGYTGLDVDEHYDSATAAAVKAWEEDLGRETPDGAVTVGEVTYLDEPTAVLAHEAVVGDLLTPGDPVLELGAESRVIDTDVLAEDADEWPVGTVVDLDWGDGTSSTGTVTEVSRDVVGGEVALVVTIADGGGRDRPIGSAADVIRTVDERVAAVAVPVAAVVDGYDGPSVRAVEGATERLVPVELGLVDGGWVEVTSGLDQGTPVRLPA